VDFSLVANAIVAGVLVGGFYAGISVGATISFGMLDIVNIAHPAFVLLGAFTAFVVNQKLGLDPIICAILLTPLFALLGSLLYRFYYLCFERRGRDPMAGLAFFFGILFIAEIALILIFGVDFRMATTSYADTTWRLSVLEFPVRLVIPFGVSVAMIFGLHAFLTRSFAGRAIMAVAQDRQALQLMGVDPVKIRNLAFAISLATAGIAGACLVMIQPVQPSLGRDYIALMFAICVLGGMGSVYGTLIAGLIVGVAESITATYFGPSWAPAVSFGFLLLTLAFRPSGLLGR
jgi:branched-chain amino acid transport system permease protein